VKRIAGSMLALLVVLVMCSGDAHAQANDIRICGRAGVKPDVDIAACSRAIAFGMRLGRQMLGTLHAHRCGAYYRILDYDAAIQDCTTALSLLPGHVIILGSRALSYLRKGDT